MSDYFNNAVGHEGSLRASASNYQATQRIEPPQPLMDKLSAYNNRLLDLCSGFSSVTDRLLGSVPEVAEGEPAAKSNNVYAVAEDIGYRLTRLEKLLLRLGERV